MSLKEQLEEGEKRSPYLKVPGIHRIEVLRHFNTRTRFTWTQQPFFHRTREVTVIEYKCLDGDLKDNEYQAVFVGAAYLEDVLNKKKLDDVRLQLQELGPNKEAYIVITLRVRWVHTRFFAERPRP